ncbi:MAG: type I DNA topoisomerase [Bacteroidales bacterium]|nr:type I DNA topoisomerase [Bacteroidales bacterium]MDY5087828.1 type I DNA topoisomerase [Alloprevotella sp.]MDY6033310.1 type I DNA topoisomerase [Alloprevotella sp.]
MPKNLVIVESPAKAKTIERFLGADYKVLSSYGHIRDLKKKNFGVDLTTFQPEYEIPADKAAVVSTLRKEAKAADVVWLASDEDREGEAIAWHLAEVLKINPADARRIVFHEITKPAIVNALATPRHIDLNLVDAQQARRVLDRLVGFRLSPVLWRKVRPNLSAGRVQSVAVRLIVEREREIEGFTPTSFYRVRATFTTPDGQTITAELNRKPATQEEAEAFLNRCIGKDFTVTSVVTKPTRRTPAPPFTTSTLQQEAARKLGYSVASTMRVAQSLYEQGYITYMRTDSMNLSTLCLDACGPLIASTLGPEYHQRRTYHTHAKGAQEAHEAIRPTDMQRETIDATPQEKRLYDLIRKRTLACQMADARLERTQVTIHMDGDDTAHFTAQGEVVKFDGFLRVYRESRENDESAEDEALLPAMTEGMRLLPSDINARQSFTKPPQRYSEASLVHKMEELGIGRPSTYAPTISTIQQREYVVKGERPAPLTPCHLLTLSGGSISDTIVQEKGAAEKGKLLPTDTGIVVNDFLIANFPDIMDYNFTANVEKDFDHVAEGGMKWTDLIRGFYTDFDPEVERIMADNSGQKAGERILGTDPATGRTVSVRIGRYGPMVQVGTTDDEEKPRFATLRAEMSMATITLEQALDLFKLPRTLGDYEGKTVTIGVGRFGPYVHHDGKYATLGKEDDPLTVSLERAIALICAKREAEAKSHLKAFAEEPGMEVRTGRYGPYIAFEGKNYKIPKAKADEAANLTLDECRAIIEAEKNKSAKPARRRTAAKKA